MLVYYKKYTKMESKQVKNLRELLEQSTAIYKDEIAVSNINDTPLTWLE